jgi:hypothetical protein
MRTIPLPDNFPEPRHRLGQVVRMLQGQLITKWKMPITGLIIGIQWINPKSAELLGYAPGWCYLISFVDVPGLPEGIERNLDEPSDWAREADVEAV